MMMRLAMAFGCLLGLAAGQPPAALEVLDTSANTSSIGQARFDVHLGHQLALRLQGPAGSATALAMSATPAPPSTPPFQGVPLGVDPATLSFAWNGFTGPGFSLGPTGELSVPFAVSDPALIGTSLHVQAVVAGPSVASVLLTTSVRLDFRGPRLQALGSGTYSNHPVALSTGGFVVVSDSAAWTAFWAAHLPGTVAPAVDFNTHFALARFRGSFPTLEPPILVTEAWRDAAGVLQVASTLSIPGIPPPLALSQPHHIVAVPRPHLSGTINESLTTISLP